MKGPATRPLHFYIIVMSFYPANGRSRETVTGNGLISWG